MNKKEPDSNWMHDICDIPMIYTIQVNTEIKKIRCLLSHTTPLEGSYIHTVNTLSLITSYAIRGDSNSSQGY